jgi:hypothetical protein
MFDDIIKSIKSGGSSLGPSSSGGSSFGSSRTPTYPDGFADASLSWSSVGRAINEGLADEWFSAYNPVPVLQSVSPEAAKDTNDSFKSFASFLLDDENMKVIPAFKKHFEDFGEIQKLDLSPLGQALISALEKLGVTWSYETVFPIDERTVMELPDVHEEGIAQWSSYFGMTVQQRFRVYKDSQGIETILWFCHVLAATRDFEQLRTRWFDLDDGRYETEISEEDVARGALTFGQWSTEFFIPSLAKKLFYLAETPFPSSIMAFPRSMGYRDLDEAKYPDPFFVNESKVHVGGAYEAVDGGLLGSTSLFPNVISMGWALKSSDFESISTILPQVTDGLVRINSYLEDGYLNFNGADEPYQFDRVVLSASTFDPESDRTGSAVGLSRWIPVVRTGFLLNESNVRATAADEELRTGDQDKLRSEYSWLANDGTGAFVASSINTFVYVWLLPEQRWDEIDRLLDAAVRLDVKNQSTNAMSNWGISFYMRGEMEIAMELFEKALNRPDGYAEAEASFFLARIWEAGGNAVKSAEYTVRSENAGGYSAPDFLTGSTLTKASKSSVFSESSAQQSRFCTNCGSEYPTAQARFCAECGTAR